MLAFVLLKSLWPGGAFRAYVHDYRDHHGVALALPGEPYDFGHDWGRLRRILDEPQAEPSLEARRLAARREYRRHLLIAAVAGLLLAFGVARWWAGG